ncbi:Putative transposase [Izhakiella capsodis]|uniref:Transposase n=2 Tax=Izhakiella capsodis TaxID=1367852 RepID=A0A1I4ZX92_9GAMM|nr:Putative transposase [Izhakiella capsodis]
MVNHYLDHRMGKHKRQTLSQKEMIGRYISHVPARHFKIVRYSGFLDNRKTGMLLSLVYEAPRMQARKKLEKPGFIVLMKGFVGTDPYKCILCGNRLRFAGSQAATHAMNFLSQRLYEVEKNEGCGCQSWTCVP